MVIQTGQHWYYYCVMGKFYGNATFVATKNVTKE